MTAFKVDLNITQGATFYRRFTWKHGTAASNTPVDLTGSTARMQIREKLASPGVTLELTTENGRITLGGAAGTIEFNVTDADTSAMSFSRACTRGVYDLEIRLADATVRRLMYGRINLLEEVTR